MRWWRRAAVGLLAGVFVACSGAGVDDGSDDGASLVDSFGTVGVLIVSPDGDECEECFWLADDAPRQARGLMGVTDLEGAAGMVFRYEGVTTNRFWMRNTLMDLFISFHDHDGYQVGSATMEPCPDDVSDADCPRYSSELPYRLAIEVPAGDEQRLGLVPGSRVFLLGECTPG